MRSLRILSFWLEQIFLIKQFSPFLPPIGDFWQFLRSMYAKEDETVEGDSPLNLNPKPHYPEESVVDNNCSLNLDPVPTWFQRRHTEESLESEKETEMSQEADDSSCREECAADKGWAHEAAASDQGDQDDHYWATVSPRRRRQASTQEDAQVTRADHWAGPGLP